MKVIDLGQHRDMLKSWEDVQAHLRRGAAKGFALMLIDHDDQEAIYLGGEYKTDPQAAARAGLQLSLAVVKKNGTDGV